MYKRKDLITLVKEEMRNYIIDSGLKAGDVLPTEADFSEMFEVSRTIIREAFSGFESLFIIESKQGKGRFLREIPYDSIVDSLSFIIEMDPEEFKNILDIRVALELFYLPKVIDQITPEDTVVLSNIFREMKKILAEKKNNKDDERRLIELHKEFHQIFYLQCGNTFLNKMIALFSRMQEYFFGNKKVDIANNKEFLLKHEQLLNAVIDKDSERIVTLLNSHFENVSLDIERLKTFRREMFLVNN